MFIGQKTRGKLPGVCLVLAKTVTGNALPPVCVGFACGMDLADPVAL